MPFNYNHPIVFYPCNIVQKNNYFKKSKKEKKFVSNNLTRPFTNNWDTRQKIAKMHWHHNFHITYSTRNFTPLVQ